jgi:hypothetical protein
MSSGPGFFTTFLYYFVTAGLITSLVISNQTGASVTSSEIYRAGILAGLIAGLVGASLNRGVTISVPVKNTKKFTKNLDQALTEMGFHKKSQLEDCTLYEKPNMAGMFSGKVLVQVEQDTASISARSRIMNVLRKKISD